VRGDFEIVQVDAPEYDTGIGWRGHQAQVTFDGGVKPDALNLDRALDRGLVGH
jgi:hypothetical protein